MALEFFFFHKCTKYTATHGAISSKRNSQTGWMTPTHQVTKEITEEIPVSKEVKKKKKRLRHIFTLNPTPSIVKLGGIL